MLIQIVTVIPHHRFCALNFGHDVTVVVALAAAVYIDIVILMMLM